MSVDEVESNYRWEHSYQKLPDLFYQSTLPEPSPDPVLIEFNAPLAAELGLDSATMTLPENHGLFTGNIIPRGAKPIAQAYAGHQYGNFTSLGDGRAILIGERVLPGGRRFDVQFKGSGRTRYSRGGDGKAALGPMLREYLISEAMHALGIPTTRSLAVAATGEGVYRDPPQPGAVLTRVAASHIRVGTFQWAAAHQDNEALAALAEYTRSRHYPELAAGDPFALFEAILERQAALIARWMLVGFVHGVMNTDNMAVSGETIDYGPCAFLDAYDPAAVFSSIDRHGRYAYDKQPAIARWNLARLAEAMLPILDENPGAAAEKANHALAAFLPRYEHHYLAGLRQKLGLATAQDGDKELATGLLDWMAANQSDFTNTFHALSRMSAMRTSPFYDEAFTAWHALWKARRAAEGRSPHETAAAMRATNPAIIPRNHLVEAALTAAWQEGNLALFDRLLELLRKPYEIPDEASYLLPPPEGTPPYVTYCGT